jgi:hypothetical protein
MKRLLRSAITTAAVALLPSALVAQVDTTARSADTTLHADSVAAPRDTVTSPRQVEGSTGMSVRRGFRVLSVAEDGTLVTLDDGIVFEVYLPDRPSAYRWQEGDFVLVRDRDAPIGSLGPVGRYNLLLINGRDESVASARFAGRERAGP